MMVENLNNQIRKATQWSAVTEIVARLIAPITNMVLARLLSPEAFGVVATLTMIISFAEIFTDAGFQKYLIQHEFKDDTDREQSTNVAFWSNLAMSMVIWGIIAILADPLATLVGNPGLGDVLIIACISIPLASFSSIQIALYKRDFDFETLFKVRIVGIFIPICVTIPFAFFLHSYWALILGIIVQNIVNAILLTIYSRWKPAFYYSFAKLKEMMSFTIWSLIEAVSIWLTNYVDVFIVGTMLNQYYLGLYKTSITIVGAITGLITSATTPILFSSLSRLQNDNQEFNQMFFKFQKLVGMLVIPIGVGIFCYSDLVTAILLGHQWIEATNFIGLWGLTSSITIILSHYSSEVYRAKGCPKLSVLAQWLHISVLWPIVLVAVKYGFEVLCLSRSLIRLEGVLVNLIIMYCYVHISAFVMIKNIMPSCIAAIAMYISFLLFNCISENAIWKLVSIFFVAAVYLGVIYIYPQERKILKCQLLNHISRLKNLFDKQ